MPLTWTHTKPTQIGWYWVRSHYGKRVTMTIMRVKQWSDGKLYVYAGKPVERCNGEWAGPISQPQEREGV